MEWIQEIKDILSAVKNRTGSFYLAGGTALSLFYFQHRLSEDLDFFTQNFDLGEIKKVIETIESFTGQKADLKAENTQPGFVKMQVFDIQMRSGTKLKVDFVQDSLKLLKGLNEFNGIPVLSVEDIYLRKIFAVSGSLVTTNLVGRPDIAGGRQEAKDHVDLYVLSHTFMPLSKFAREFCGPVQKEGLIRWFNTFDRFRMKSGLLELRTKVPHDWQIMERHFKDEIGRLIAMEVDSI
ncbi:MAG: nucleotidyl transferase AbiEii/AbiGii toxin family protein [Candidatus Omnitrophota bacterium]